MHRISVRHNFESAHRLSHPDSSQKRQSIHGHSWWVTVWIEGEELDERGMLVEYGAFKKAWRGFLDEKVDHHLILREGDPMAKAIRSVMPECRILETPCEPTTEELARWLCERATEVLPVAVGQGPLGLTVAGLGLEETATNSAEFFSGASSGGWASRERLRATSLHPHAARTDF